MGKRLTIFCIMVIVGVVAIDLGAVHNVFAESDINTNFVSMFILGTVPMFNVLMAGLFVGSVGLCCERPVRSEEDQQ